MQKLPSWDLKDLYSGIDDPKIEKDFLKLKTSVQNFDEKYRGKITEKIGAGEILIAIQEYEAILQSISKIISFAQLAHSTNGDKPEYGAFLQKQLAATTEIENELLFFDLELNNLSEEKLKELAADSSLENYRHFLLNMVTWKPHRLSEAEEKIINDKKNSGAYAFSRLFEQEHANKEYLFVTDGKEEKMNEAQILNKLQNPDREERKKGAQALTKGLGENLSINTFAYNMIVQDKLMDDRYFKFEKPEDARHKSNEIENAAVDAMIETISGSYDIVQDFYEHKKQLLGYEKLYDYDRYAPLKKTQEKTSYEDARKIVLESFEKFSPKLKGLAEDFFINNWIDAGSKKGKQGGAFCHYVTPDLHPFVLLNYQGDITDISTLAHELGHGVHACLAKKQSYLNFNWPLTLAETASVFAEMVTFETLKEKAGDLEEKRFLYATTIERIFSSVHRQNAMFLFEREVFAHAAEKGELSKDDFSKLWREKQTEMFGNSVELTENYDIWWSYIPHFINTPFYVYAYSFGELLSLALFAKYREEGDVFVEKYLEILQAGGSKSPQELFAPLGIDLSKKEFWEKGVGIIREMVKEFKELS